MNDKQEGLSTYADVRHIERSKRLKKLSDGLRNSLSWMLTLRVYTDAVHCDCRLTHAAIPAFLRYFLPRYMECRRCLAIRKLSVRLSADFEPIFARSASAMTRSEKSKVNTNRKSTTRFQWVQDEHRTLFLSPQRAQKRKVSKIWTISCANSETVWDRMSVTINH